MSEKISIKVSEDHKEPTDFDQVKLTLISPGIAEDLLITQLKCLKFFIMEGKDGPFYEHIKAEIRDLFEAYLKIADDSVQMVKGNKEKNNSHMESLRSALASMTGGFEEKEEEEKVYKQ